MFEGESIHSPFSCKGLHCIMKPEISCLTINGNSIFFVVAFTVMCLFLGLGTQWWPFFLEYIQLHKCEKCST